MEQSTKLGSNKTGIDMSPIHSKQMLEASENLHMESLHMDSVDINSPLPNLKQSFIQEADPLGSVPIPGTVRGVAQSLLKTATGHHPEVFINKLGERLAYERSGIRIYDAFIMKCELTAVSATGKQIDISQLKQFRTQEAEHFELLTDCIVKLGADPTAQTPDADAIGVAASGLMKVITDPRASISQSLEAMLALELADNAGWDLLIKLAEDMGKTDMAEKFRVALRQEDVHLVVIRQYYEELVRSQAKMFS